MSDLNDIFENYNFDYSSFLFCPNKLALTFYIPPNKLKSHFRRIIEKGGGKVSDKATPGCIRLLLPDHKAHSDGMTACEFIFDSTKKKCLQDLNDYKVPNGSSYGARQAVEEPTGKTKTSYSVADDDLILEFLSENGQYLKVKGNSVWKSAEKMKVTSHTWQSMKDRFKKHIMPSLGSYAGLDRMVREKLWEVMGREALPVKREATSAAWKLFGKKKKKMENDVPQDSPLVNAGSSSDLSDVDSIPSDVDSIPSDSTKVEEGFDAGPAELSSDPRGNRAEEDVADVDVSACGSGGTEDPDEGRCPSDTNGEDFSSESTIGSDFIDIDSKLDSMKEFIEKQMKCSVDCKTTGMSLRENSMQKFRPPLHESYLSDEDSPVAGPSPEREEVASASSRAQCDTPCLSDRLQFLRNMKKIKIARDWLDVPAWVLRGALFFNNGDLDAAVRWLLNPNKWRLTFNHKDDRMLLKGLESDLSYLETKHGEENVEKRLQFLKQFIP